MGLKVIAQVDRYMLYSTSIKTPTRIKSLMLSQPFTALKPGITRNKDKRMFSPYRYMPTFYTRSLFFRRPRCLNIYFIQSSSELQPIAK